jgi:hypothetical protein
VQVNKTTPIFFLDELQPALAHYRDRLGYAVALEIPGFAILQQNGSEIMLQTFHSGEEDLPAAMPALRAKGVAFYHEVDDVEQAAKTLKGVELIAGPRTTEYGMREIFVQDEWGFVHGYAKRA